MSKIEVPYIISYVPRNEFNFLASVAKCHKFGPYFTYMRLNNNYVGNRLVTLSTVWFFLQSVFKDNPYPLLLFDTQAHWPNSPRFVWNAARVHDNEKASATPSSLPLINEACCTTCGPCGTYDCCTWNLKKNAQSRWDLTKAH